jgi:hypothetical protein
MKRIRVFFIIPAFLLAFQTSGFTAPAEDTKTTKSTAGEATFSLDTTICDLVKTSSRSGINSSVKRCVKDFDSRIDSFRIKLKMRLKNSKALRVEKGESSYRFSYASELTTSGKIYNLGNVTIDSGSSKTTANEIFAPTNGQTPA